jgi:hypothetical protein
MGTLSFDLNLDLSPERYTKLTELPVPCYSIATKVLYLAAYPTGAQTCMKDHNAYMSVCATGLASPAGKVEKFKVS